MQKIILLIFSNYGKSPEYFKCWRLNVKLCKFKMSGLQLPAFPSNMLKLPNLKKHCYIYLISEPWLPHPALESLQAGGLQGDGFTNMFWLYQSKRKIFRKVAKQIVHGNPSYFTLVQENPILHKLWLSSYFCGWLWKM